MLIVPGFAVPAGTNLFKLLTNHTDWQELFENFYISKSGNFYITLLL